MGTAVGLRFPWGRYHATPWGRPANEAAVEWPPSPWRLLRALYATWRWRVPDLAESSVVATLSALAPPPQYRLGRWNQGHTRHYLPDIGSNTSKVLDAFVAVERGCEIFARWDAELGEAGRECLGRLCQALPYLGRAEGICSARLVGPTEELPEGGWVTPDTEPDGLGHRQRVLAPIVPLDIEAMVERTTTSRGAGYVQPRGSRWVGYAVAPTPVPVRPQSSRPPHVAPRPNAAVLLLDAPVLPTIRDTVWVAHVARMAALQKHGDPARVLAGKDEDERRLEGHRHAHYLPLANDDGRLIDRIVIWAPQGLGPAEVAALSRIRRLRSPMPGFRSVRVALQASGPIGRLAPELTKHGSTWTSVTPFATFRHRHPRRETEEEFILTEVKREAQARGLPPVAGVDRVVGPWLDFKRNRPNKSPDPRVFGLEVRFAEPVVDQPVCLGALSHFGLGRFAAADD